MTPADTFKARLKDQYTPCLARACQTCRGQGWLQSAYSAVHPEGGHFSSGVAPATSPPVPCDQCTNGFQFLMVPVHEMLDWLFAELADRASQDRSLLAIFVAGLKQYAEDNPKDLLQMVVEATEDVMRRGV